MKFATLALTLIVYAQPVFAAKFTKLSHLGNPELNKLAEVVGQESVITGAASYAIIVPTPSRGRAEQEVLVQTLKQALVGGVCSFFDESIVLTQASSASQAMSSLDQYVQSGDEATDASEAKIQSALEAAMQSGGLEVYGGDASGNNTAGAVVAIYDRTRAQILVFGSSNCGSDN